MSTVACATVRIASNIMELVMLVIFILLYSCIEKNMLNCCYKEKVTLHLEPVESVSFQASIFEPCLICSFEGQNMHD